MLRVGRETPRGRRVVPLVLVPVLCVLVSLLAACRQPADRTVIAVLVGPGGQQPSSGSLSSAAGQEAFADRVLARCPACVVSEYDGATGRDARIAVADGADVIVVQSDTTDAGADVVAASGGRPVVAVDTLLPGADWFVGFDRSVSAVAVADSVSRRIGGRGRVLLLGGAPVDRDTDLVDGLRDGLAGNAVEVAAELDATTGSAEEAREWVAGQLADAERPPSAVLAVSDEQAQGVVEAFSEVDLARPWPLVAGIGGDLEAVRRVVGGDQTFTVHLPLARAAEQAADVALSLVSAEAGGDLGDSTDVAGVPAYVLNPVVVSVASVTDTVVRDGTYTTEQICAGDLEDVCADLGIR